MLAYGEMISSAGYAVGYESIVQFTREYDRMFGPVSRPRHKGSQKPNATRGMAGGRNVATTQWAKLDLW